MRKYADFILLLPLLTFGAYVAFTYLAGDGEGWQPPQAVRFWKVSSADDPGAGSFQAASVVPVLPNRTATPGASLASTTPSRQPATLPTATATLTPRTPTRPPSSPTSASTPTSTPWSSESVAGIDIGDAVVAAIESYGRARGAYPASLDELIPEFLPALPQTVTDQTFSYRQFVPGTPLSAELYWLAFALREPADAVCTYYRRVQYWDCYSPSGADIP